MENLAQEPVLAEKKEPTLLKKIEDRISLLSRGIVIPPRIWYKPVLNLQSFRGGPGPQGRTYYFGYDEDETPKDMISIPIYPKNHYLAKYAVSVIRSQKNPHNLIAENGVILKGIKPFRATRDMQFSDGGEIQKSGLINVHSYGTYATNLFWTCRYFESGEECKYCTIDVATKRWKLPNRQSDEHIIEALQVTAKHKPIRSVTITSGTHPDPNKIAKDLTILVKKLKKATNFSVHVQLEPVSDYNLLKELSTAADSVGIFLEVFDENIRKEICPGKAKIPKEKYFETWKEAVKYFGWGNVWTTCLLGFGEDFINILPDMERCAKLGVRYSLLFARPGSKSLGKKFIPSYLGKEKELLDFHMKAAQILLKNNLQANVGKGSGCTGCYGCSAMVETCQYVKSGSNQANLNLNL